MLEITLFSNKTKSQLYKNIFVSIVAIITWLIQISIFSNLIFFNCIPNLLLLGTIYFGLTEGLLVGLLFSIISSFLNTSILYDHSFSFSLPLVGLVAGFFTKNIFLEEKLFFIVLAFLLTFPFELFNGWTYTLKNQINLFEYYPLISSCEAILNTIIAPFYYQTMRFVTNKLKRR